MSTKIQCISVDNVTSNNKINPGFEQGLCTKNEFVKKKTCKVNPKIHCCLWNQRFPLLLMKTDKKHKKTKIKNNSYDKGEFCKKCVLKNSQNSGEKHLCWSSFSTMRLQAYTGNFIKKRFQQRRFPANFAEFHRSLILLNICEWLFCHKFPDPSGKKLQKMDFLMRKIEETRGFHAVDKNLSFKLQ